MLSNPPTAADGDGGVVGGLGDADASLASAMRRSAAAMSGRRSSSSEGRPTGMAGGRRLE